MSLWITILAVIGGIACLAVAIVVCMILIDYVQPLSGRDGPAE